MAFVKIDKEILNSYCFANPNHLKIWIWLLIKANFKTTFFPLKIGKGCITVKVDRGQLIFGRFKAEEELGLDGSLIYRALKTFEEQEQIIIEANNQYSIITICKYDDYQGNNSKDEQPTNNQRTADEQQMHSSRTADEQQPNTYKEVLEDKEYKEVLEGKELKEKGGVENLLNGHQIIPTLCRIWYNKFPTYAKDQEQDFKAVGEILRFMMRQHSITDLEESRPQIESTFEQIATFVSNEKFWKNKALKAISNNIQEFYNKIKNGTNEKQSLREAVQAEFNKRYSAAG